MITIFQMDLSCKTCLIIEVDNLLSINHKGTVFPYEKISQVKPICFALTLAVWLLLEAS